MSYGAILMRACEAIGNMAADWCKCDGGPLKVFWWGHMYLPLFAVTGYKNTKGKFGIKKY